MSDLAIQRNSNRRYDLVFDGRDLSTTDSLENAVALSLLCFDRDDAEEGVARVENTAGGFWGNATEEIPMGSKIWTKFSSKLTEGVKNEVAALAQKSLQWMIEDGVASAVNVSGTINGNTLELKIEIRKPDGKTEEFRWQKQWEA